MVSYWLQRGFVDGSIAWPEIWGKKGKDEFLKPKDLLFPGDGKTGQYVITAPL